MIRRVSLYGAFTVVVACICVCTCQLYYYAVGRNNFVMGGFFSEITMHSFSCCHGFSIHHMSTHIIVLCSFKD